MTENQRMYENESRDAQRRLETIRFKDNISNSKVLESLNPIFRVFVVIPLMHLHHHIKMNKKYKHI